jgi:hypothetical protein
MIFVEPEPHQFGGAGFAMLKSSSGATMININNVDFDYSTKFIS